MLLAMDVGNTNIVLGLFDDNNMKESFRLSTDKDKTLDEYGIIFHDFLDFAKVDAKDINAAIISSVVPPVTGPLIDAIKKYFGVDAELVGKNLKTKINIVMDNPKEVGSDNIVNSVAVRAITDKPAIVIDLGTANTYHYLNEKGDYLGGIITPGFKISMDALSERTSKLPRVELEMPEHVLGKNTVESIKSGLMNSKIGEMDYIIKKILQEIGKTKDEVLIVATGGLAEKVAVHSEYVNLIEPNLTLLGLYEIYKMNHA